MRWFVPVFARMFVGWAVMRLMDVVPVRLVALRRTYVVSRFGPVRLVVVPMLRRSLVVVVAGFVALRTAVVFVLMILGTAVMVVIVPVLCIRRSACCESKS
jgi:hypothetical protein